MFAHPGEAAIKILTFIVAIAAVLVMYFVYRSFSGDAPMRTEIKPDEHLVFFGTAGWYEEASQSWHLPVHGWIYEPQNSRARKAAFAKVLQKKFDLTTDAASEANFDRRLNLIIADNERGKRIVIESGGREESLPPSANNGHIETVLRFSEAELAPHIRDNMLSYSAINSDGRSFDGRIELVGPLGYSIISDIDDTIKVSGVTDRRKLLENTFLKDFEAVPGMADVYRDWLGDEGSLHFVSSSPWQLYEPLNELIEQSGFPPATLNLKSVRFRDETLFDLFKKGTETKPAVIRSILDRYPRRHFLLVGDSGEQDPEVYAALLRERPEQIKKVYIRNVTDSDAGDDRFGELFDGIDPASWQLFTDPGAMSLPDDAQSVE